VNPLRNTCIALALCALSTLCRAEPAHYLVFSLDDRDVATVQFYARVDATLAPRAREGLVAPSGERLPSGRLRVGVAGYQGAALRYVDAPLVERLARVETADDAGRLVAKSRAAPRAFALRLPAALDTLVLDTADRRQRFDLKTLAAQAQSLPLATLAKAGRLLQAGNGPPGNRVDLLIIGDGYTQAERSAFQAQALALQNEVLGTSPQREYAALVNVTQLFVASPESGADHPRYQAGCTQATCCADPEASVDPLDGQMRNTALDASFCTAQIHRLLTVNRAKALAAAAAMPDWDVLLVVVNDPVYGGSGGDITVASSNDVSGLIMVHEYGHRFSDLGDEYSDPYPGFPACSDTSGFSRCEPNVTDATLLSQIKWKNWIAGGTPIPTPQGRSGVGLFQGARYQTSGMYRPTDDTCLMHALGNRFCPVCAEAYVLQLYSGGPRVHQPGIDLIEPGTESPSTAQAVGYTVGDPPRRFSATVLRPQVDGLVVEWRLDGVTVANAGNAFYDFQTASATPAQHILQLRVFDGSGFLRADEATALALHTREWRISVAAGSNSAVFRDGFE
jgi:hypothetical protein